jgi:hypothetical protein
VARVSNNDAARARWEAWISEGEALSLAPNAERFTLNTVQAERLHSLSLDMARFSAAKMVVGTEQNYKSKYMKLRKAIANMVANDDNEEIQ